MEALTRLKQMTSVVAYKGNFEILSNRIIGLSESQKLSCFLSGLKDKIRLPVRRLEWCLLLILGAPTISWMLLCYQDCSCNLIPLEY